MNQQEYTVKGYEYPSHEMIDAIEAVKQYQSPHPLPPAPPAAESYLTGVDYHALPNLMEDSFEDLKKDNQKYPALGTGGYTIPAGYQPQPLNTYPGQQNTQARVFIPIQANGVCLHPSRVEELVHNNDYYLFYGDICLEVMLVFMYLTVLLPCYFIMLSDRLKVVPQEKVSKCAVCEKVILRETVNEEAVPSIWVIALKILAVLIFFWIWVKTKYCVTEVYFSLFKQLWRFLKFLFTGGEGGGYRHDRSIEHNHSS